MSNLLETCEEVVISVANTEKMHRYKAILATGLSGKNMSRISFAFDSTDFRSYGPAKGIYSCLKTTGTTYSIVVPVDMPLISTIHLNYLKHLISKPKISRSISLIGWLTASGKIPYPFFIANNSEILKILEKLKNKESVPLKKLYSKIHDLMLIQPADDQFLLNFNYPPAPQMNFQVSDFEVKSLLVRNLNF